MTTPSTGHELDTLENAQVEQQVGATLVFTLVNDNRVSIQYERATCCHEEGNIIRSYNENGVAKHETQNIKMNR